MIGPTGRSFLMFLTAFSSALESSLEWPGIKSRVKVIQLGQLSYQEKYSAHAATIQQFAAAQGFNYSMVTLANAQAMKGRNRDPNACVFTAKVRAIREALHDFDGRGGGDDGDWVLFIDLDIQYATCNHGLFRTLMPLWIEGTPCDLIAQDSAHSVNTGFVALRRSAKGLALSEEWLREQVRLGGAVCEGAADQVSLQSVILKRHVRGYSHEKTESASPIDTTRFGAAQYTLPCDPSAAADSERPLHASNLCFAARLSAVGLPEGHRSGKGLCLVPSATTRLNMHDARDRYRPGDVFRHDKTAPAPAKGLQCDVNNQGLLSQVEKKKKEEDSTVNAAVVTADGARQKGYERRKAAVVERRAAAGAERRYAQQQQRRKEAVQELARQTGESSSGEAILAEEAASLSPDLQRTTSNSAATERTHNATLILSAQRCGSNWISRMIRNMGLRPFGQEAMLDFCTDSRAPKYGALDQCFLANGNCNQCNKGNESKAEKRRFCTKEKYASCVDNLLGQRQGPPHGQSQGLSHGFLIKYDHFTYSPLGHVLRHFKTLGVGVIHVTRDPLFIWLSLQDHNYKNKHGKAYGIHVVNLEHFATYHALYTGWAARWARELNRMRIPVLDVSYEELAGRESWTAWNTFASFLGAPRLSTDPASSEAGAFSTPPCKERIANWPAVAAHPTVQGTRTEKLCADPFDSLAAAAAPDFLSRAARAPATYTSTTPAASSSRSLAASSSPSLLKEEEALGRDQARRELVVWHPLLRPERKKTKKEKGRGKEGKASVLHERDKEQEKAAATAAETAVEGETTKGPEAASNLPRTELLPSKAVPPPSSPKPPSLLPHAAVSSAPLHQLPPGAVVPKSRQREVSDLKYPKKAAEADLKHLLTAASSTVEDPTASARAARMAAHRAARLQKRTEVSSSSSFSSSSSPSSSASSSSSYLSKPTPSSSSSSSSSQPLPESKPKPEPGSGSEFEVSLVTRTFSGRRAAVLSVLPCFDAILPGSKNELVYVLDDETAADHALGAEILQHFRQHSPGLRPGQVRVEFEPLPKCHDQGLFVGRLEGNAGKDRSQRSNFLFDAYAHTDIVAMFDAEICFLAPIVPAYFARKGQEKQQQQQAVSASSVVRGGATPINSEHGGGGDGDGRRLQVLAMTRASSPADLPTLRQEGPQQGPGSRVTSVGGDHWGGVDSWALGHDTPLDVMWLNNFPLLFWRRDLKQARDHLTARFAQNSTLSTARTTSCAFGTAFDSAFALVSGSEKKWGYDRKRSGFSQFNLLVNFVAFANPGGYTFHVVKSSPEDVRALVSRLPSNALVLAADFRASAVYDPFTTPNAVTPVGGGLFVPAANANGDAANGDDNNFSAGPPPLMRRLCCEIHSPSSLSLSPSPPSSLSSLSSSSSSGLAEVFAAGCSSLPALISVRRSTAHRQRREREDGNPANPSSPWPPAGTVAKAAHAQDRAPGSGGRCFRQAVGDPCFGAFVASQRAHLAEQPKHDQRASAAACAVAVEAIVRQASPPNALSLSSSSAPSSSSPRQRQQESSYVEQGKLVPQRGHQQEWLLYDQELMRDETHW